jgi:hypothetical protein
MTPLTHWEDGGGRGIELRELNLPDDQTFGTGSYRVHLLKYALRKDREVYPSAVFQPGRNGCESPCNYPFCNTTSSPLALLPP